MVWHSPGTCRCCKCSCPVMVSGQWEEKRTVKLGGKIALKLVIDGFQSEYNTISFRGIASGVYAYYHTQTGMDQLNGTYFWDVKTTRSGCFYRDPSQDPLFFPLDSFDDRFDINHSWTREEYDNSCNLVGTTQGSAVREARIIGHPTADPYGFFVSVQYQPQGFETGGVAVSSTMQALLCEHDFDPADYSFPVGRDQFIRAYYFMNRSGGGSHGGIDSSGTICGITGNGGTFTFGTFAAQLVEA